MSTDMINIIDDLKERFNFAAYHTLSTPEHEFHTYVHGEPRGYTPDEMKLVRLFQRLEEETPTIPADHLAELAQLIAVIGFESYEDCIISEFATILPESDISVLQFAEDLKQRLHVAAHRLS